MKGKTVLLRWAFVIVLTLGLAGVLLVNALNPAGTLQGLEASEIAYVTAEFSSQDETIILSEDQVERLLEILHSATFSQPLFFVDSTSDQEVTFTITEGTGIQMTVVDRSPYLTVKGFTYQVDDDTCQAMADLTAGLTA